MPEDARDGVVAALDQQGDCRGVKLRSIVSKTIWHRVQLSGSGAVL
jgi:hypothetical protein